MRNLTLDEAIVDYSHKVLANKGASTRKPADQELERFRKWVIQQTQQHIYLRDIDADLVGRYFARLRPPAKHESTFNNYRQYHVSFWEFCVHQGWVLMANNPIYWISALPVPKVPRVRLSPTEMRELLARTVDCGSDVTPGGQVESCMKSRQPGAGCPGHPRDRIMFVVAMNTGIRNQDLAALTVGDGDLNANILSAYIAKKKKTLAFPVDPKFRQEILDWYEIYADLLGLDSIRGLRNGFTLIPPLRGRPLAGGGHRLDVKTSDHLVHPQDILKRYLVDMGFETHNKNSKYDNKCNNLGLHILRRSGARALMNVAAARGHKNPIRVAQTFLDHESQKVTEVYVGVDLDMAERDEILAVGFLDEAAELEDAANATVSADVRSMSERKRRYA